jgi:hypothetical protein
LEVEEVGKVGKVENIQSTSKTTSSGAAAAGESWLSTPGTAYGEKHDATIRRHCFAAAVATLSMPSQRILSAPVLNRRVQDLSAAYSGKKGRRHAKRQP